MPCTASSRNNPSWRSSTSWKKSRESKEPAYQLCHPSNNSNSSSTSKRHSLKRHREYGTYFREPEITYILKQGKLKGTAIPAWGWGEAGSWGTAQSTSNLMVHYPVLWNYRIRSPPWIEHQDLKRITPGKPNPDQNVLLSSLLVPRQQ